MVYNIPFCCLKSTQKSGRFVTNSSSCDEMSPRSDDDDDDGDNKHEKRKNKRSREATKNIFDSFNFVSLSSRLVRRAQRGRFTFGNR